MSFRAYQVITKKQLLNVRLDNTFRMWVVTDIKGNKRLFAFDFDIINQINIDNLLTRHNLKDCYFERVPGGFEKAIYDYHQQSTEV